MLNFCWNKGRNYWRWLERNVYYSRKSLLLEKGKGPTKKGRYLFDVAMGVYDGVEV